MNEDSPGLAMSRSLGDNQAHLIGVIPEDECVIISTNRGEPLVLEKKLSLPGIAFENTAYRLDGQQVDFIDFDSYSKGPLKRLRNFFLGSSTT